MFGLGCAAAATPADAMSMSEKSVVRWKKQAVGIVRGGFIRVSDYTLATAQATPLAIRTRRRTGGEHSCKSGRHRNLSVRVLSSSHSWPDAVNLP